MLFRRGTKRRHRKIKNQSLKLPRFKGLGEISPDEFKNFIGDTIRLDPIMMDKNTSVEQLLSFIWGKIHLTDRNLLSRI